MSKEKTVTPPAKNTDAKSILVPDETDLEIESLESQLLEIFNEKFVKVLKRLVYEIAQVGLSEKEACLLMNFDYDKLVALKAQYPVVQRLFDMKQLQYKRDLLKTISSKARASDDKLAQWLLESKYPEEFNKRKGAGGEGGGGEDLLGTAIEFVRKTSSGGVIKEESGRAFVLKGHTSKPLPSVQELLKGRAAEVVMDIDKNNGDA